MYIWLHNNLPWYDMDFIFVYVIKHKWLNLSQFFEHICMSLNRDTDNLHFHQSRDHEDSSWFEIANSSWSREFLMIVGRNHCHRKGKERATNHSNIRRGRITCCVAREQHEMRISSTRSVFAWRGSEYLKSRWKAKSFQRW